MAELAEAALAEATLEDLLFLDQAERPAAFQPCLLNFTALGIEIQHNDQQQWFVPWEAMPEIMDSDASLRPCSVPESHPHVKQLHARFSFGFSNCAGCQFHLACRSEDQAECISRIVQLRSSQAVAMEGLPGLETDHVETREAQSYLEDTDVTSSPAGIFHTAPATLPFSSTPRPPICVEEAQPSREIVQHNLQLPEELLSALLDEPKVPEPLVLQHVWLHLPPVCPHYHRCLLQVDKLGLSLRPLGRSRKAAELNPISGLKVLQTESLSFPLSSILDVEEVFELLPPMGPMGVSVEPRTWKQQFGRKHYIPLARFIFSRPWKASEKQKPCPEYAERLPAAAAYFAVVKVRAGVTGKMPGQERRPAWRMRDPRPPVQLALAFYQKEEVTKLIATVLSFKSYQASTALQSILFKTRAIHARSKIPCEAEESPQDAPSEARLSASQPRIISNDDGGVFWYVPKKQGHLRENGSDTAGSSKVRPKPDFSDDRATISI